MRAIWNILRSSVTRKYIVSITGFCLVAFVLVHLLGNLQIFIGKDLFNTYAYHLHHLPPMVFWGFRIGLGICAAIHIFTAMWLTIENMRARPKNYKIQRSIQASISSLTMPVTGILLFLFVVLHLLNFTLRRVPENYEQTLPKINIMLNGIPTETFNVYKMLVSSFSVPWISVSYILAMAILCLHISHGVSSMFQSIGLRNEKWRNILDIAALLYGWIMFLGFVSIPITVACGGLK